MGFNLKLPSLKGPAISNAIRNPASVLNPFGTINNVKNDSELMGHINNFSRNVSPLHRYLVEPMLEKKINAPDAGEDPQVTALRQKLYGEAENFENDLPGMQNQAFGQIDKEGNQVMKSGLKSTRQNFNRRGLLYSGLREGGEQDVRGKVAGGVAQQKAQSNKELTDMARAKWTKAAQVGLQGYQDAVNREAEISGINLQNQVARAQAMQALGNTVGQIGGSYYGSRPAPGPYTGAWSEGPQATPNYSSDFRSGNLRADSYYG